MHCALSWITKAALAATIVLPSAAFADPPLLKNDPKRPVAQIAYDLGVQPQQFSACFENVRPAPRGTQPTAERQHANKAVLLGCLQKANPAITNEKLDAVMDRYRPG